MRISVVFVCAALGMMLGCKSKTEGAKTKAGKMRPARVAAPAAPVSKVKAPPPQGSPERPVLFGHVDPKTNPPPPPAPPKPPPAANPKLPKHHPLIGTGEQVDYSGYIRENYSK